MTKIVGANDAYKNNSCQLSREVYRKIIDTINKELIKELFSSNSVKLPVGFGALVIVKSKISAAIKNNKLVIYNAINWAASKKYWKEHPEEKKIFIRHTNNTIYRIKLYKTTKYRNSPTIFFTPASPLRQELSRKIIEENYNTVYEKDNKYKANNG